MTRGIVKKTSDGSTIDLDIQEAEQSDTTARAKRVINVDSTGTVIKAARRYQNISGSAGTGIDGAEDRVYTITSSYSLEIVEVYLDGLLLVNTSQYTIDNGNKQVTILINAWNTQTVSVVYYI